MWPSQGTEFRWVGKPLFKPSTRDRNLLNRIWQLTHPSRLGTRISGQGSIIHIVLSVNQLCLIRFRVQFTISLEVPSRRNGVNRSLGHRLDKSVDCHSSFVYSGVRSGKESRNLKIKSLPDDSNYYTKKIGNRLFSRLSSTLSPNDLRSYGCLRLYLN